MNDINLPILTWEEAQRYLKLSRSTLNTYTAPARRLIRVHEEDNGQRLIFTEDADDYLLRKAFCMGLRAYDDDEWLKTKKRYQAGEVMLPSVKERQHMRARRVHEGKERARKLKASLPLPYEENVSIKSVSPALCDEHSLSLAVIDAFFAYLGQQGKPGTIQRMDEVTPPSTRVWTIQTTTGELVTLVSSQQGIFVQAPSAASVDARLGHELEEARCRLHEVEQRLRWFEVQCQSSFLAFETPLPVRLETLAHGQVRCFSEQFPFQALGSDEDEAKTNLRLLLNGVHLFLMYHEAKLSVKRKTLLHQMEQILDDPEA